MTSEKNIINYEGGFKIKKALLLLLVCFLMIGCNKMDSKEAINKYKKIVTENTKYTLTGEMDIVSNEELYHYNVKVDYKESDYYKATLTNKTNNYEQIILKNETGVYVVTPSLNKSYKFESEWPYNSSQAYILSSLLKDLENDSNVLLEENDDKYILNSTVNYPNNTDLISQKITFDKEMNPQLVQVYNKNGNACITLKISKIDFEPRFDDNYFKVEYASSSIEISDEKVSSIEEIIYPMYLPVGTTFKGEETIKTEDSQRVILTFTGEKPFTLIEEATSPSNEFEITSAQGELVFYENILGNLTNNSLSWSMNGKDYYIISDNLTNEELLKVASSTSAVANIK